jgi:hypothetical protein
MGDNLILRSESDESRGTERHGDQIAMRNLRLVAVLGPDRQSDRAPFAVPRADEARSDTDHEAHSVNRIRPDS